MLTNGAQRSVHTPMPAPVFHSHVQCFGSTALAAGFGGWTGLHAGADFSMKLLESLERHREEFLEAASDATFIVFLCGPNLKQTKPSAKLRLKIKEDLEKEGFEVVLGEDEGLTNEALTSIGINAQDNELEFIPKYCNAVVIVADSLGAFCELGLFSWHFVHEDGAFSRNTDCIVLLNKKYRKDQSYLNLGPGAAVTGFGKVEFITFSSYDGSPIVARLKARRGVHAVDNKRGRPRASPS
jgi:hypothetical protein